MLKYLFATVLLGSVIACGEPGTDTDNDSLNTDRPVEDTSVINSGGTEGNTSGSINQTDTGTISYPDTTLPSEQPTPAP